MALRKSVPKKRGDPCPRCGRPMWRTSTGQACYFKACRLGQTVHFMNFGMTACLVNGPPNTWPAHHKWSPQWDEVNCPACLAGRELIVTFTIAPNGKSITCLKCKRTSYNPNDVEHHWCGYCHVGHDDIWPPARKAWLNQT